MAAHQVRGRRVEVSLYGLAPQHTYREAYPFLTQVYRELLAQVDASAVTVAGDSAGGGLALGFAQTLPREGLPQPHRLVLLSPWLDLTLSHPDLRALEPRDPWLNIDGTVEAGKVWAGGHDPTQPKLSPINGDLAGLAPMYVTVGTRELCLPDVLLLQERAAAAVPTCGSPSARVRCTSTRSRRPRRAAPSRDGSSRRSRAADAPSTSDARAHVVGKTPPRRGGDAAVGVAAWRRGGDEEPRPTSGSRGT